MSSGSTMGRGVEGVLQALCGHPAAEDRLTLARVGALVCEGQSLALLGHRTTLTQLSDTQPGAASSVRKLVGMGHAQDTSELALELLGPEAAAPEGGGRGAGRCLHPVPVADDRRGHDSGATKRDRRADAGPAAGPLIDSLHEPEAHVGATPSNGEHHCTGPFRSQRRRTSGPAGAHRNPRSARSGCRTGPPKMARLRTPVRHVASVCLTTREVPGEILTSARKR
jgi:hypothetical protein